MLWLLTFIFTANSDATLLHCSPNPPDGTFYVDGVLYDNPKPKNCYSVMRKDGSVMDRRAILWNKDHFEEDAALLKVAHDYDYAPEIKKEANKAAISEIQEKIKKGTALPEDIVNYLKLRDGL